MTDWVVRRWARFGHERLYATTPGGTELGYYDLKTSRFHSDDVTNLPLLEKAIADHLAAQQAATASPVVPAPIEPAVPAHVAGVPVPELVTEQAVSVPVGEVSEPVPVTEAPTVAAPAPTEPEWEDLSTTRAGAAARERARAEREAAGAFRTGLARLLGVKTEERAWRIGADGEEAVAAQLAKLGPLWRVLHAVRVGENGSDIDHVVIGPAGVFTINAKHHPQASVWVRGDTFKVNGFNQHYVRNSRHEAQRAARLLTEHSGFPVTVTGVIAVMGAHKGLIVKEQPRDGAVVVLQRKRISQHLLGLRPMLTGKEVDGVFEAARRSTTWRPNG